MTHSNDSVLNREQYIVRVSEQIAYDYGRFAQKLGNQFLTAGCAFLEDRWSKPSGRGWIKRFDQLFLKPFQNVCECLEIYLKDQDISSASDLSSNHWRKIVALVIAKLVGQNENARIITSHYWLLRCLEQLGAIPYGWDPREADRDGPFFLHESRNRFAYYTHDATEFAATVGHEFVGRACQIIRDLKDKSGRKQKSWIDAFVIPFLELLKTLENFLKNNGVLSAAELDAETWKEFVDYLSDELFRERISKRTGKPTRNRTKDKRRIYYNMLLSYFFLGNLLPGKYQILSCSDRSIAPTEEKEAKDKEPLSPYLLWIPSFATRKDPFSFEQFQSLAGAFILDAMPHISDAFFRWGQDKSEMIYNALNHFLRFLQSKKEAGLHTAFFSHLATDTYKIIDDLNWEQIIYEWREELRESASRNGRATALITKHKTVMGLKSLWEELSQKKILPEVRIKGFIGAKNISERQSRPCLAQLTSSSKIAQQENIKGDIRTELLQYFDDIEQAEAAQFINALCEEMDREEIRFLTLDSLITKIRTLNRNRLETLRACAEIEFQHWHDHWKVGQRVLEQVTLSKDEIRDLLDNDARPISERRRNSARLLGGSSILTDSEHEFLGNCLLAALASHQGILTGIFGRYHHISLRYGGKNSFHAYLHPHQRATLALWIILLIDTGANCEVVRQMPFDCLRNIQDPSHMQVSFDLKGRANYKRIQDHLPIAPQEGQKISAIQAISTYKEMSQRYRQLAKDDVKDLLFLDVRGKLIIGLTEFRARDDFVCFLSDHPELASLNIRPSFIRPSYLLERQHSDPHVRIEVAQAAADHTTPTTTDIYTGRAHTRLVQQQQIRIFQNLFQSVIIRSIEGAAEKLGITKAEAEHLFSEAARSGLGVACLNPKAGIQPGTKPGDNCTRLDACPGCEMRYVVGTIENITDLILFEEYLRKNEEDACSKNPSAWEERWLPWLVLAEVALAKLQQGETASAFAQAKIQADIRRASYKAFPLI
jgi:hypothetical protein